jgi:hypothetical protein
MMMTSAPRQSTPIKQLVEAMSIFRKEVIPELIVTGTDVLRRTSTSHESAIREAGFDVLVIPDQGAGAASARIETARRHFPRIFFNAGTTEDGRDALGWYHEKKSNDDRNIGLGPNHDWSSHECRNAMRCIMSKEAAFNIFALLVGTMIPIVLVIVVLNL